VTCHWKDLDESYNFVSNLIAIRGLKKKLSSHKVAGVPTLAISKGVPRLKAIWMKVLQRDAKYTIWGKVVASPESGPW
jgi:hypothetical protein